MTFIEGSITDLDLLIEDFPGADGIFGGDPVSAAVVPVCPRAGSMPADAFYEGGRGRGLGVNPGWIQMYGSGRVSLTTASAGAAKMDKTNNQRHQQSLNTPCRCTTSSSRIRRSGASSPVPRSTVKHSGTATTGFPTT